MNTMTSTGPPPTPPSSSANGTAVQPSSANVDHTSSLKPRSLAAYFWPHAVLGVGPGHEIPAATPGSAALAADLKRRGWRFVGPTTVYALMQAMGLVNDHIAGCVVREEVEALRLPVVARYRS